MSTVPVPVAVVGAGRFGALHAGKYAARDDVRVVAVVDPDLERARTVAVATGAEALPDVRGLAGRVAAASVTTPTTLHHSVAAQLIDQGIDVFVEKPITATLDEADDLIRRARDAGRVLQVGHLERFNPTVVAVEGRITRPLFIEVERLGPFPERSADVDVVLDLMIHDLDLLLHWVARPVRFVHAVGVAVVTPNVDIASARIEFEGGAVANVAASRVSLERARRIRIFQPSGYLSLDLDQKSVRGLERDPADGSLGPALVEIAGSDALADEIDDFVACVRDRTRPRVTGEHGRAALAVARRIIDEMRLHRERTEVEARGEGAAS